MTQRCTVTIVESCARTNGSTAGGLLRTLEVCLAVLFAVMLPLCAHSQEDGAAVDAANKMYFRTDIGVFFLSLPESSPFIETDSNEELTGFLDHYDASHRAGPLVRLTIGGEYNAVGRILFAEARGFIASHSSRHVNEYERTSELWDALEAEQFGLTVEELRRLSDAERERRREIIFDDKTRLNEVIEAIRLGGGPQVRRLDRRHRRIGA